MEAFAKGVQLCLARERNWTLWKDGKCRPFERYGDLDDDLTEEAEVAGAGSNVDIRQVRKTIRDNTALWSDRSEKWREELGGDATACTPNIDDFLQPMLDAMDPENCVEDEYHPKHDAIYNWRGLRLVYAADLRSIVYTKEDAIKFEDGALITAVAMRAAKAGVLPKGYEHSPPKVEKEAAPATEAMDVEEGKGKRRGGSSKGKRCKYR